MNANQIIRDNHIKDMILKVISTSMNDAKYDIMEKFRLYIETNKEVKKASPPDIIMSNTRKKELLDKIDTYIAYMKTGTFIKCKTEGKKNTVTKETKKDVDYSRMDKNNPEKMKLFIESKLRFLAEQMAKNFEKSKSYNNKSIDEIAISLWS